MIEFFIIGNLGADAVMNETKDFKKVINFSVCHSETTKKRQEEQEIKKHWVDCAYFVDSTELLDLLKKGTLVYAKGFPSTKVHKQKDGTPISVQYLRVSKVEILSKKRREELGG
jgi:single-stranded DNA-binding protein